MKNKIILYLFLMGTSFVRSQGPVVQNLGNLCVANHEEISSSAYSVFRTTNLNFDSVQGMSNSSSFLCNYSRKLFLSLNNGPLTSPSFSNLTSIYYHPSNNLGNSVSGKFNSDELTDFALVNSLGDIITLKNTGYPSPFAKDSISDRLAGGHLASKLIKCQLNGAGPEDLVAVGISSLTASFFVVRPYLNSTPSSSTAPLLFIPQPLKIVTINTLVSSYKFEVKAADLDNNGSDELVFASESLDSIYLIYSFGGTLNKQYAFSPGPGFTHKKIVLVDIDGDGVKEIAISGKINSNNVNYVALYSPIYFSGNFVGLNPYNSVFPGFEISDFNFADMNDDGLKELVISKVGQTPNPTGSINIFTQIKIPSLGFALSPITFTVSQHFTGGIAIADVDNNKRTDIISYPTTDTSSIVILKNFTFRDSLYAAPTKSAMCPGETFVLKNNLIRFIGPYYTNIVPSLSVVASVNHTLSINTPGNYTVNAMYTPYVGGNCIFQSNNVMIQQGIVPNLSVVGNNTICYGTNTQFNAQGADSYTWVTQQGNIVASALVVTPTASIIYTLTGKSLDNCVTSITQSVIVKPEAIANINYDKNFLCKNQSATLEASGGISYTWTTGETTPKIVITQTNTTAQTYNVYVKNVDGCSSYASFSTNYNDKCKEIVVIKGITPNSGGENSHLYIENIENYPENVVSIYNRWGTKLFSEKGYDNSDEKKRWPNKEQSNLASGTYYYVLELGQGNGVRKGWIEIFSN